MPSPCTKDVELITPTVFSAPRATASSSVISLLAGGSEKQFTNWTSEGENPVDMHFVFDFDDHRAPARIEWSDWGREDGAAYMKLAVSDDVHGGWVRVCGWPAQQTQAWQSYDIAPENRCLGRYWKITIKRAHSPGFGLQLRGLRLYAFANPALPDEKCAQSIQVHQAVTHEHTSSTCTRLPTTPIKPHSWCLATAKKPSGSVFMSMAHDEGTELELVELVKKLRAENAQLTTKVQDVQRTMTKAHAAALAERDEHLHALQQQLQEEAQKAMREQARALKLEGDLLHLRRKLHENHTTRENNVTASEGNPVHFKKVEEERDEAVRARKHLESALSHVLNTQGWYAAPVDTCKRSTKCTSELSPVPSTQASTQVSPEPSPPSSPRLERRSSSSSEDEMWSSKVKGRLEASFKLAHSFQSEM